MKKFSLLSLCLTATLAMSAQTALVDEVKHMLGQSKPNFEEALAKIQPALTNPETKDNPNAWYLAGKAGIGVYDSYLLKQTLGEQLTPAQEKAAGEGLYQGYIDYFHAIPIDFEIDKKTGQPKLGKDGQPKPGKLQKEMQKTLKDNYVQLRQAGAFLYDAKDYMGAYDVWQIYVDLPTCELLGNDKPTADPDSIVGQTLYYQFISALLAEKDQLALDKLPQIEKTGFHNPEMYIYGIQAANKLGDSILVAKLAQKGYELYGTENIEFIGQLINQKMAANDYAGAQKLVEEAIATTSSDDINLKSRLLNILGIIYESQDMNDKALATFEEAMKIDPSLAKNYYDAARVDYNQAMKIEQANPDEYNISKEAMDKFLKSAELFEKAYELDPDTLTDIPRNLYNLYYMLGDGYVNQMNYWKELR